MRNHTTKQTETFRTTPWHMDVHTTDRWIHEKEASDITGMSIAWFQRKRWAGGGIPYSKIGSACRYRLSDVLAYMAEHKRKSTNDIQ